MNPTWHGMPLSPVLHSFIAWIEKVRVKIKRVLPKNTIQHNTVMHCSIHRTALYYLHFRLVTLIPCSTNEGKVSLTSLDCVLFRWWYFNSSWVCNLSILSAPPEHFAWITQLDILRSKWERRFFSSQRFVVAEIHYANQRVTDPMVEFGRFIILCFLDRF